MKATQRDFAAIAPRAAREARIAFLCGPDEAGAAAAAERLIALLPDAGERIELSGPDLRSDPVRLGDEARSGSLFGGARHILVRAAGDEVHDAVETFLSSIDSGQAAGACPIVVVASAATDKARTAKLLAGRSDTLVGMFHPPDLKSMAEDVRRMAAAAGVTLTSELAERMARAAGLDVRLAQSEVNKLALYLDASAHSPKTAHEQALDAVGARTEEDGFMPLVNAVFAGETGQLPGELRRMHEISLSPVGVLLALERRAAQLMHLTARKGLGGRVDQLLEAEQRAGRVFFRDKRDLQIQLQRWSPAKLQRLIVRLDALHRALFANSQTAELLLAQELAELAHSARAQAAARNA